MSKEVEILSLEDLSDRPPVRVTELKFEVLVYDPRTWEVKGRFDHFDEHEHVLCMSVITVAKHQFIAIGEARRAGGPRQWCGAPPQRSARRHVHQPGRGGDVQGTGKSLPSASPALCVCACLCGCR
jgi:hypothetical protein